MCGCGWVGGQPRRHPKKGAVRGRPRPLSPSHPARHSNSQTRYTGNMQVFGMPGHHHNGVATYQLQTPPARCSHPGFAWRCQSCCTLTRPRPPRALCIRCRTTFCASARLQASCQRSSSSSQARLPSRCQRRPCWSIWPDLPVHLARSVQQADDPYGGGMGTRARPRRQHYPAGRQR